MSLPDYTKYRAVWIEKTKSSHGHGGQGWEFGSCLWSPTLSKSGQRIYKNMEAVQPGDLVLHFYEDAPFGHADDHYFCGMSLVATAVQTSNVEPPLPGDWADRGQYFRINLDSFAAFPDPLPLSDFVGSNATALKAIVGNEETPFAIYRGEPRLGQGKYLSPCGPQLYALISSAIEDDLPAPEPIQAQASKQHVKAQAPFNYEEYVEGQRAKRETNYFVRNPQLVRDAKAHYGAKCQGCGFVFADRYGSVGNGYIEIHHLNPLSEKAVGTDEKLSTLKQVTALCANCHRMIHRLIRAKRRSVSIEEFKAVLEDAVARRQHPKEARFV